MGLFEVIVGLPFSRQTRLYLPGKLFYWSKLSTILNLCGNLKNTLFLSVAYPSWNFKTFQTRHVKVHIPDGKTRKCTGIRTLWDFTKPTIHMPFARLKKLLIWLSRTKKYQKQFRSGICNFGTCFWHTLGIFVSREPRESMFPNKEHPYTLRETYNFV